MRKNIWTLNSRYAVVSCFAKGESLWIEKTISTPNTETENPSKVNEISNFFRKQLSSKCVPLVEPYYLSERHNDAIQTSPFAGPDVEKFFSKRGLNKKDKFEVLEKIIFAMSGILLQGLNPDTGIDARLSNFCVNDDGNIFYVDTFPALIKYNGEYIVHYPNPSSLDLRRKEITRKFDCYGIIRRFRFSILEHEYGLTEKDLLLALNNVLGKNFSIEVENYFSSLPKELPNELDADTIREIAISQAAFISGKERENFLTEIFELSSSFGSINLSTFDRLNRINYLLNAKKIAVA